MVRTIAWRQRMGRVMWDEYDLIPLADGDPPPAPAVIGPNPHVDSAPTSVRCKRSSPRRACSNVLICFSPEFSSGKVDPTECPVINVSAGGFAIEFDYRVQIGQRGTVSYRAENGRPVHVGCVVRHCVEQMDGLFQLGLKLDRNLQAPELRPMPARAGREVAPGIRLRKLGRRRLG